MWLLGVMKGKLARDWHSGRVRKWVHCKETAISKMPTGTVKPECGHGQEGPLCHLKKGSGTWQKLWGSPLTEFGYIVAQLEEQTVFLVFETQSSPGRSWTLSPLAPVSTRMGGGGDYRAWFTMWTLSLCSGEGGWSGKGPGWRLPCPWISLWITDECLST